MLFGRGASTLLEEALRVADGSGVSIVSNSYGYTEKAIDQSEPSTSSHIHYLCGVRCALRSRQNPSVESDRLTTVPLYFKEQPVASGVIK
jgi:hypothetical protein